MVEACQLSHEVRPYYWLEESAVLYTKCDKILEKLKKMENIMSPDLDSLIDLDLNLLGVWDGFEKDAMTAVEKINNGSLAGISVPAIFGLPEVVYYYNGILIYPTFKSHVFF